VTKYDREIMEILEAFDLTGCPHSAAQLAGADPKTVARYVAIRDAGGNPFERPARPKIIDPFPEKIEELVERSKGKIRADVVHERHWCPWASPATSAPQPAHLHHRPHLWHRPATGPRALDHSQGYPGGPAHPRVGEPSVTSLQCCVSSSDSTHYPPTVMPIGAATPTDRLPPEVHGRFGVYRSLWT
jgi:hypothetical protein